MTGACGAVSRGPCFPCLLFILAVFLCKQAVSMWNSYEAPWLRPFCFFHQADEFAGVWAVASVALRGPAIYQTEAESAGSPKGKKHGLLYRLPPLPPPFPTPPSLLLPPALSVTSLRHVIQSCVCVKGITGGMEGGYWGRGKKKDGMWPTVFSTTPYSVIVRYRRK